MRTLPGGLAALAAVRLRLLVGLVGLALVAAAVTVWAWPESDRIELSADFGDTTGLYVGNDVDYLGVPIGSVTAIERMGTRMRVHMEFDPDSQIPADAGAVVMQSSLVTDRYVALGPTYTGGPTLASGAHIDLDRTRSPATIDEVSRSVDDLVVALDRTTPGGHDLGDLIHLGARVLDGNGGRIREALIAGQRALHTVNLKSSDLRAITYNVAVLVHTLAGRDETIRRFSDSITSATGVLARQRHSLARTLVALNDLSRITTDFVRSNHDVIATDLRQALQVARQIHARQDQLAEAFDTMPTLAQNLVQAYDWKRDRLRVQFALTSGPFSRSFRADMCASSGMPHCDVLFAADGSGLLDPLFDMLVASIPGGLP